MMSRAFLGAVALCLTPKQMIFATQEAEEAHMLSMLEAKVAEMEAKATALEQAKQEAEMVAMMERKLDEMEAKVTQLEQAKMAREAEAKIGALEAKVSTLEERKKSNPETDLNAEHAAIKAELAELQQMFAGYDIRVSAMEHSAHVESAASSFLQEPAERVVEKGKLLRRHADSGFLA